MDDAHREQADAPPASKKPRRRKLLTMALLLLLMALSIGVALWWPDDAPAEPVATAPPPPPVVEPVPPPPPPTVEPAPTPLKTATRKKAELAAAAREKKAGSNTVVVTDARGGDAVVRRALQKAFSRSLGGVDVRTSADSGYAVTVIVDDQKQSGGDVTVRCAASVALLPKMNVLASLKARADASGEGTPTDELMADAAEACGQTLAKDLTSWVKQHPF